MVSVKLKGIENAMSILDPKRLRGAVIRALDKTAKQGKTEAQRYIRDEYNIKLKDLKDKITTDIHPSQLEAVIISRGGRLPLMLFNPKQQGVSVRKARGSDHRILTINTKRRVTGGGVSVQIKKGQRKLLPGTFIAKMKSGHVGVFERKGKSRLKIKEKVTIDVDQMFGSQKVIEATKKRVIEQWEKNFKHEIDIGYKYWKK